MKLLLCPAQFQLAGCELVASEEVEAGTVFHPWSGQLSLLPGHSTVAHQLEREDPRLQHGLLDTETACNWVRYLPPTPAVQANLLVHCGSLGEPTFTVLRQVGAGERLAAHYTPLRPELCIPAVQILRLTLYTKYVERAIQEAPCNLVRPRPGPPRPPPRPSSGGSLPRPAGESREGSECSGAESPKLGSDGEDTTR